MVNRKKEKKKRKKEKEGTDIQAAIQTDSWTKYFIGRYLSLIHISEPTRR